MEAYIMPSVAIFCCIFGFVIKQATPTMDRLHDFLPLICMVLGIVLVCAFMGISLDGLAQGAVSGVAATGIWEQATHLLPPIIGEHGGD